LKLNAKEQKARRDLAKAYHEAFKKEARSSGLSYLKPTPFKRLGDWFVAFYPSIWTDEVKAEISANVKPYAIDDLFGDILGYPSLVGEPVSLRARGPHCLTLPMFSAAIESDGDVEAMVQKSKVFMEETLARVPTLTIDEFIDFSGVDRPAERVSENQVVAMILAGRRDEAARLCELAVARKQTSSLSGFTPDGERAGLFSLALRSVS